MKKQLIINDLTQLKNVSDPFRIELLKRLYKAPKTGQMLADELNMSRAKVHYHLNALSNAGIIQIVKSEQLSNITQKFYAPVAKKLIVNNDILDFVTSKQKK